MDYVNIVNSKYNGGNPVIDKLLHKFEHSFISLNFSTYIAYDQCKYALVYPEGNGYIQLTGLVACRETITEEIMSIICRDKIESNKIRIMIVVPSTINPTTKVIHNVQRPNQRIHKMCYIKPMPIEFTKERIFIAKNLLNIFERYAGFGQTKVIPINPKSIGLKRNNNAALNFEDTANVGLQSINTCSFWIFVGSKGWLYSPSFISLYLLLMRFPTFMPDSLLNSFKSLKNIDDVISLFKDPNNTPAKLCRTYDTCYPFWLSEKSLNFKNDYTTIYQVVESEKIKIILKRRRKIFGNRKRYILNKRTKNGILSLCTSNTYDMTLNKVVENVTKKGEIDK